MILQVFSADGASVTEKDLSIPEFEGDKGLQALKQVLVAHAANQRQGNASTKTRAEVHGTGKKPFRQKGTGMARQGTKIGPQHYHGGVAFGPKPRDYSKRINRKMKKVALSRALFDRVVDGDVSLIEKWEVADKKTKLFNELLTKVAPKGKTLVVDDSWSDANILAARNIARLAINEAKDINAYDLSRYDKVVLSEKGMEILLNRLQGDN